MSEVARSSVTADAFQEQGSEFWKNRRVFVTGATGLLGSWLVEKLISAQAEVTCLVRDWVPGSRLISSGLIQRANIVRGELEDYPVLNRALNEYECDSVFHLGAQTIVGTSSRSAFSTFEANIHGTWNLLEACKSNAKLVQRVVIASSDKAYGSQDKLPYTEDTPLQGRFPYDVSKACADLISISYASTYEVPLAITRCGNLYGGGDLNFNRIVPGTMRSVLQDEFPIIRSDGKFIRDYIYVKDAVLAYLSLAERLPEKSLTGEAFNFAPERPLTVLEIVSMILRLMNREDLQPVVLNQASHEIYAQYLDCTKAREILGWSPKYTTEQGLVETIDWYARYFNQLRIP